MSGLSGPPPFSSWEWGPVSAERRVQLTEPQARGQGRALSLESLLTSTLRDGSPIFREPMGAEGVTERPLMHR